MKCIRNKSGNYKTFSVFFWKLEEAKPFLSVPPPVFLSFLFLPSSPPPLLQVRSREYNADIQVHTVRHAMLEQLRNPPSGEIPLLFNLFSYPFPVILLLMLKLG